MAYFQLKPAAVIVMAGKRFGGGCVIESEADLVRKYGGHMVERVSRPPGGVKRLPDFADIAMRRQGVADRRAAVLAEASARLAEKTANPKAVAAEKARAEAEAARMAELADEERRVEAETPDPLGTEVAEDAEAPPEDASDSLPEVAPPEAKVPKAGRNRKVK